MGTVEQFERFAADFERSVADDAWSRLAGYFTEDATYENLGDPDSRSVGREAVLAYLQRDVSETDRRFDSRTLVGITEPVAEGDRLARRWRITYTLAGTPDLVLEGESRYRFEGDRIASLEVALDPENTEVLAGWMARHGDKLVARGSPCSK